MVAAKDRRHAFSGFTLNRRAVRFMKALPFPWNVFTPAALMAQAPGAPGRAGSGAGFYLDSQAALRRACFASSRVLRGSRSWRFEVWELRDRAFLGGTRDPGTHSLLRSNRAGSVCLQGAAKTHLFTQACLWVVALWRLPSPTSERPGRSGIISSSLPLHVEGLMLAQNCLIIGLIGQRTPMLTFSMWWW